MSGSIPTELGNLEKLERLWLSENDLAGEIPEGLGNLVHLVEWRLAGNDLTGCVPAGLAAVEDSDLDQLGLEVCRGEAGVSHLEPETPVDGRGEPDDGSHTHPVSHGDHQITAYSEGAGASKGQVREVTYMEERLRQAHPPETG